jgi:peptidoglycan L-alanyl-D-glutamate endopeptidase CwlK
MSEHVCSDLALLAPGFRARLLSAIADAESRGLDPLVFETIRNEELQREAFERGASKAEHAWQSWHYFGLASDVISRRQLWDAPRDWWVTWGECVERAGLAWGGRWSQHDYPHAQWGSPMRISPSYRARVLAWHGGNQAVWRAVKAFDVPPDRVI